MNHTFKISAFRSSIFLSQRDPEHHAVHEDFFSGAGQISGVLAMAPAHKRSASFCVMVLVDWEM